jgi:hypothetical protein
VAAQMNVSMLLTLVDRGSPVVRSFMGLLDSLGGMATTVGTKLAVLQQEIRSTGTAASATSRNVTTLNNSLARTATLANNALTPTSNLSTVINNLGASVQTAVSHVNTLVAGLGGLNAATAALNRVGQQNPMGNGLTQANQQASGLSQTLKGVAALWSAMEMRKALKVSAEEAMTYEVTQTRLVNMGLSSTERAGMIGQANTVSSNVPQFDRNQTLEMGLDLRNATGSAEHAIAMLEPFTKAAFNMQMATPDGKTFDMNNMLLIAKALEQRNATNDTGPDSKMQQELDMMQKIYAATQGRVDAQQILGNLQYSRGGLGQSLNIEFMPIFAALIEQVRSSGGNGGTIGTALTALQRNVLTGTGSQKEIEARYEAGLIDPSKLAWNKKQGTINLSKSQTQMAGADEFQHNPYEWVQNYLKPAMIRAGIDLQNDAEVNAFIAKNFHNGQTASLLSTMINRGNLIDKDAANINQTENGDKQYQNNMATAKGNLLAFEAQLRNLGIVIGTSVLPEITKMLSVFTEGLKALIDYFDEHPVEAKMLAWAAAILAITLAITGMKAVFGIVGGLTTLIEAQAVASAGLAGKTATGMTGAAASAVAGSGLITNALKLIPIGLGLVGTALIAFTAGWEVGRLFSAIEIDGKPIQEYVTDFIEWMANLWTEMGDFLSKATDLSKYKVTTLNAAKGQKEKDNERRTEYTDAGYGGRYTTTQAPAAVQPAADPRDAMRHSEYKSTTAYGGHYRTGTLFDAGKKHQGTGSTDGRFKHYDAALEDAKNAYRLEEYEEKAHLTAMEEMYKANKISVKDFYDDKLATITKGIKAQIVQLQLEKAEYAKQGDKAGVKRVETDIKIKEEQLIAAQAAVKVEEERDYVKLKKDGIELDAIILVSEDKKREARLTRNLAEIETIRKRAELNHEPDIVAKAGVAKDVTKAEDEYEKFAARTKDIEDVTKQRIENVQNLVRTGAMTPTDGENAIYELRQKEAEQLDLLIVKMLKYLELADIPADVKADLRTKIGKVQAQSDNIKDPLTPAERQLADGMDTAGRSGLGQVFANIANGSMSASKAIEQFGQNMRKTFLDLISKKLGDALWDSLFGNLFKGGNGGGGMLDLLFKGISGFMGGGSGTSEGDQHFGGTQTGSVETVDFSNQSGSVGSFPSRAVGTNYVPYDMLTYVHKGEAIVPEIYNPSSNDSTGASYSQKGGLIRHLHSWDDSAGNMSMREHMDNYFANATANR